jgi:hypothetical protein
VKEIEVFKIADETALPTVVAKCAKRCVFQERVRDAGARLHANVTARQGVMPLVALRERRFRAADRTTARGDSGAREETSALARYESKIVRHLLA